MRQQCSFITFLVFDMRRCQIAITLNTTNTSSHRCCLSYSLTPHHTWWDKAEHTVGEDMERPGEHLVFNMPSRSVPFFQQYACTRRAENEAYIDTIQPVHRREYYSNQHTANRGVRGVEHSSMSTPFPHVIVNGIHGGIKRSIRWDKTEGMESGIDTGGFVIPVCVGPINIVRSMFFWKKMSFLQQPHYFQYNSGL